MSSAGGLQRSTDRPGPGSAAADAPDLLLRDVDARQFQAADAPSAAEQTGGSGGDAPKSCNHGCLESFGTDIRRHCRSDPPKALARESSPAPRMWADRPS
jgi:hypothetical protein